MAKDFDAVLLKVGEFGRYQKLVTWLLCLPACFLNAYGGFGLVFQAFTPQFRCIRPDEDLLPNKSTKFDDECEYVNASTNQSQKCQDFEYDQTYFRSTIITDYSLVCDGAIYYKNIMSFFSVLSIVGCFGFSIVQDKWGRKKAFFISLTMYLTSGFVSIFAPNLWAFTILRIPGALGTLASWNVGYIWAMEYAGPSKRTMVTFVLSITYGIAAVSLGLISWPCRTWVQLTLVTTAPFVLLYSYYFILDESPRWLMSEGRVREAEVIVRRIAGNKEMSHEEISDMLTNTDENNLVIPTERFTSTQRMLALFKGRNLRLKCILITCCWFSTAVTYSAIAFNMENLGGNLYLNYILQAAVEIPATVLILLLLNRIGRVLSLVIAQVLFTSLFAFLSVGAEYIGTWALITCAIFMKFGSCLSFAIVVQFAGELFPTVVRGSGTGFSSSVGEMGNIVMPYIIHASIAYRTLPLVILGLISLITGFGSLFLPETSGQLLPETLDEAEERGLVSFETFKTNISRIRCGVNSAATKSELS